MSGTVTGGKRAAQKNLERNPNFYRDIGHIGGKAQVPKGFAINDKAMTAGAKGGYRSKKGYKFIKETESSLYYIHKDTGKEVKFFKK